MALGEAKCRVIHVRLGKVAKRGGITSCLTKVQEMAGSYRYLGTEKMMGVSRVGAEHIWRVRKTWHTNLNIRKTVQMHNVYCVGALRYISPIARLTARQRLALDRRTRNILTQAKAHHPKMGDKG